MGISSIILSNSFKEILFFLLKTERISQIINLFFNLNSKPDKVGEYKVEINSSNFYFIFNKKNLFYFLPLIIYKTSNPLISLL